MQRRRDKVAAKKFFRKLLKGTGFAPRVITDKMRSYGAAKKDLTPGVEHRQHRGLNNRAENSHCSTRTRERRMGRVKSPGGAQRLLAAFEPIRGYFHPHQHQHSGSDYRVTMSQRFADWCELTRLASTA